MPKTISIDGVVYHLIPQVNKAHDLLQLVLTLSETSQCYFLRELLLSELPPSVRRTIEQYRPLAVHTRKESTP